MNKSLWKLKILFLSFAFALVSCGQQGSGLPALPGVQGPIFNVIDGKVMVTINLLAINLPLGAKIPVPRTRDSYFEVSPNVVNGGSTLQFLLDPAEIKDVTVSDEPNTLPDGRALPGIPGGILPSLRVDTDLLNTTFYFSESLFGFYIPFNLDTRGFGASYPFRIQGEDAGILGLVSSDTAGNNSGIIIFLKLDALKSTKLKALIELSERNPHVLY